MGSNIGTYAEQYNQGLVQNSSSQFVLSYALQLEIRRNFERWHVGRLWLLPAYAAASLPELALQRQRGD